jgi:general secretion pathway protein D
MNSDSAARPLPGFLVPAMPHLMKAVLAVLLLTLVHGCAVQRPVDRATTVVEDWLPAPSAAEPRPARVESTIGDWDATEIPSGADIVEIDRGTGRFINEARAGQAAMPDRASGDITLNFEAADLREVVHFILGQLLDENYVLHPGVTGTVTLQTSQPLSRDALLPTLEDLLRLNDATLVARDDGLLQVLPREGALRGTSVPRTRPGGAGLNVRIVPLRFIAATEMVKILEPFLTPDGLVRVDPARNMLILSGSRRELAQWEETIGIFDVDWVKGMSVGLFTLRNADVGEVVAELDRVTSPESGSPLAGLFNLVPIPRLNAVLVITPQARFLDEAKVWIDRLDRSRDVHRTRLYVYRMQHARADEVAKLLTEMYGGETTSTRAATPEARLAPGMEPVQIGDADGAAQATPSAARPMVAGSLGGDSEQTGGLVGEVRIIADESNNSLLIMAGERDYEVVTEALRQMDISPLQVLVDATIIEVSLTDELRYGLQWYFTNSVGRYDGQGILADSAALARTFPGFNYSIVDSANQVRAVLSALAQDSRVNVLSSPSVMVLDNQEATIRVGDQVPIRSSESTSVVTDSPVTVTTIQYRDTGVSLRVTPRVNAGGMVRLDIEQEVNDVSTTTSSGIDSPTIQQRLISSTVAVQSGETIVLGGLIRETTGSDQSGIPVLYKLPLIGPVFGATTISTRRTELIVLLTPRVAHDSGEARAITEDFRRRMQGLERRVRGGSQPNEECGGDATGPC